MAGRECADVMFLQEETRPEQSRLRPIEVAFSSALAIVALMPGFFIFPVADDWRVLCNLLQWQREGRLLINSIQPYGPHWSPLWFLVNILGFGDLSNRFGIALLTVFKMVALASIILTVLVLLKRAGAGKIALITACVVTALHQANVAGMFQWKSIGQIYGNAFGLMAAVSVYLAIRAKSERLVRSLSSGALLFIALLFKETAFSFAVTIGLIFVIEVISSRRWRIAARQALLPLASVLIFLILRQILGTPTTLDYAAGPTAERYTISRSPLAWGKNEAMLDLAVATPVSTVIWIDAVRRHQPYLLAAAAFVTAGWLVLMIAGLLAAGARSHRVLAIIAGLGISAVWFPVGMMPHVSEVYASAGAPWYAILVALAAAGWLAARPARTTMIITVLVFFLLTEAASFAHKTWLMASTSRAELRIVYATLEQARRIPPGKSVWVGDDVNEHARYSFFSPMSPTSAPARFAVSRYFPNLRFATSPGDADFLMVVQQDAVAFVPAKSSRRNGGGG